MEEKNSPVELVAELVAALCFDPGFVLLPHDRYEELIRAETERDVLEATIDGANSFNAGKVLDAIKIARRAQYLPMCKTEAKETDAE